MFKTYKYQKFKNAWKKFKKTCICKIRKIQNSIKLKTKLKYILQLETENWGDIHRDKSRQRVILPGMHRFHTGWKLL